MGEAGEPKLLPGVAALSVIPANAEIQTERELLSAWVPAYTGIRPDSRLRGNKPGFSLAQE